MGLRGAAGTRFMAQIICISVSKKDCISLPRENLCLSERSIFEVYEASILPSTRLVLCLRRCSPQRKKYRAERPPFFLTFYHSDSAQNPTYKLFFGRADFHLFLFNRPKIKENGSWESPGSSLGSPWDPKGGPVRKEPAKRSSSPHPGTPF